MVSLRKLCPVALGRLWWVECSAFTISKTILSNKNIFGYREETLRRATDWSDRRNGPLGVEIFYQTFHGARRAVTGDNSHFRDEERSVNTADIFYFFRRAHTVRGTKFFALNFGDFFLAVSDELAHGKDKVI